MKSELMPSPTSLRKGLNALEKRERILIAQIQSVCQGYTNAGFVFGPGGLGKSHLVTGTLDAIKGKGWKHHTAYSTPKALILALDAFPDAVHLFEDCEKMYKNDVCSSILRAACGSPKQRARVVTYETAHESHRITFTGGILIVSNEDISKGKGPMQAVASRFKPIKWDMTIQERVARILQIAGLGWSRGMVDVSPKECLKVAEFLVTQMLTESTQSPIDIRTFVEHAMPAYLQNKQGSTDVDWRDIVRSKLSGQVEKIENRSSRNDRLRVLVLALDADAAMTREQRISRWKKETGLSQPQYYRHLKAAKAGVA
jgi:hypothetical protein